MQNHEDKMCRTEEDIKQNDIICQEILDYIERRKKDQNGEKLVDIILARALLKNRVISIQTKENVDTGFDDVRSDIRYVQKEVDKIKKDCEEEETFIEKFEKNPWKTIRDYTIYESLKFIILYIILVGMIGINNWVDQIKDFLF